MKTKALLVLLAFLATSCRTPPPPAPPAPTPAPRPSPSPIPPPQTGTGPVLIGVIAPLTGPEAARGASERDGVLMAVEEWNARGGVLGRKIQAVVEDSSGNPIQAKAKVKWMISVKNAKYIVGDVADQATIAATDLAEEEGVVMIGPASTHPRVTHTYAGAVKAYVFRACFTDSYQGEIAAEYLYSLEKKRSAAVLSNDDSEYSMSLSRAFVKRFTGLGGRIAADLHYSRDSGDLENIVKIAAASKAEVIYVPDRPAYVNSIAAQARKLGSTAVFAGGDSWASTGLDRQSLEGGFYTVQFSGLDRRPQAEEWSLEYEGNTGSSDVTAALSYDAADIILQAIEKAGTDDPSYVKEVIAKNRWNAATGPISFNADHDPVKPGSVLKITKDGDTFVGAVGVAPAP